MRTLFGTVSLAVLVACGGSATVRGPTTGTLDATRGGGSAEERDPHEQAWARRETPEGAERALQMLRSRAETLTDDTGAWVHLAEAHFFVGSVHAVDDAARAEHADLGIKAAERAVELLSPETLTAMRAERPFSVTAELVPAVYWRARNRRLGATAKGYAATLLVHHEDFASMTACARLVPEYDQFGAFVYLGRALSRPPDLTTRDLPAAARHFERAIGAAPARLSHRIAYAEHYAVVAGDRALFERELAAVRDATDPAGDETGDTQRAKARAAQLLEQLNELFE